MNITMKKKLIVTSLLAASVFASAANAGVINVTGSIAANPCVIKVASATQNVTMPAIFESDLSLLTTGGVIDKSAKPIKFELQTCPTLTSNAVVTFKGTSDGDAFSLGSTVKGVALKLFDKQDKEVNISNGVATSTTALGTQPEQTLEYTLKYVKTAAPFAQGAIDTTIDFDITYN
ncbi:putative fimbrial protein [Yersinia enterocolitica]|uniref:fimbrial protein n=1 Tax=Yersinia enterocolitica TaxID=630 RepID=UPI000504E9C6|nr:fimbrial protein [Yersinia enterocolitica]ELI8282454.1 fimbrial protein [Yersinia enterocolitica]KGA78940.1 fimbrial family protein [Yersinia enterocolitica]MCE3128313.1 fimbrial protein [Yersinia enterocolitica]RLZ00517.1 oxidoreductase [Yersinia enterocolitica]CFQ15325.1 putative fimbrial protein [Yersinia enterocolitica]